MRDDEKSNVEFTGGGSKMTSADIWKVALESVGDGVWDWNAQTNRVYYSKTWKAMLGFEPHEIGDTLDEWERRVHPDDSKHVSEAINRHFEGKTPIYTSEHRVMCKDGTYKWILDRGQVVSLTPDGEPLRVVGTHTDLTKLKQAENIIKTQRDLGISISSTSNLMDALQFILDAALQLEGIDSGGVYLIDPCTGELNLMVHRGLSQLFIQSSTRYSANTPHAKLVAEGKPIYVHFKVLSSDIIKEQKEYEGLLATAIIPVLYEGKVIAALNIASHTYKDIPANACNAIEDLATRIGCVIARIQAEEALHESQQNLQALFDTIDDMLFILDSEGRMLKTNLSAQTRLGYTLDELHGLHVLDFHPPEQREEVASIIADMLAGKLTTCPIPLVRKDGSYIQVETKVTRGKWGGRDVLFGISRDITDRKNAEEALRKREAMYRELTERMNDVVWTTDLDLNVTHISPSITKIVGFAPEDFIRKNIRERITPESFASVIDLMNKELQRDQQEGVDPERKVTFEMEEYHRNGSTVWVECIVSAIRESDGKIGGLHGVSRDVTKRKQMEKELQKYHDNLEEMVQIRTAELANAYELLKQENGVRRTAEIEVERRRQELEDMNAALRVILKQREEDKSHMEMNVISNHKVSIVPYLDLLEKTSLNPNQHTYLSIIRSNLDDITATFNRKISAKSLSLTPNEIKVASLVKEGKTTKEIANLLMVSINTVNTYRRKIREKSNLKNENVNLMTYLQSLD